MSKFLSNGKSKARTLGSIDAETVNTERDEIIAVRDELGTDRGAFRVETIIA